MQTLDDVRVAFPKSPTKKYRKQILKPALSNADCFNASFTFQSHDVRKENSRCHSDCDMLKVHSFFDFLRGKCLKDGQIYKTVKEAIQCLVSSLPMAPSDVQSLRIYMMLPSCHLMNDSKLHDKIIGPFARSWKSLPEKSQKILDEWLRVLPLNSFKRYLKVFKQIVSHLILSRSKESLALVPFVEPRVQRGEESKKSQMIMASLSACIWVMDKFYKVNQLRHELDKLPHSNFVVSEFGSNAQEIDDDFKLYEDDLKWSRSVFRFCKFPFLYNVESKFRLLRLHHSSTKESFRPYIKPKLTVRRNCIIEDALKAVGELRKTDQNIHKKEISIWFDEEDDDGPGVNREFYTVLFHALLEPSTGLFKWDESSRFLKFQQKENGEVRLFPFVGYMLGLLLYNSELVNFPLPLALFKKLLGMPVGLDDLIETEPEVAKDLKHILERGVDLSEKRTFEVTRVRNGNDVTYSLCKNGKKKAVTDETREEYVRLMVDFYLNKDTAKEFEQLNQGFKEAFDTDILKRFLVQPSELRSFIIGKEKIDFRKEEKNVRYLEGYHKDSKTIRILWKLLHEMKQNECERFMQFVTGCERVPLSGLDIIISRRQLASEEKLEWSYPRATTCNNQLHLPDYLNEEWLKDKLSTALYESDFGFTADWTPNLVNMTFWFVWSGSQLQIGWTL